jgi:hypothetical protein
MFYQTIHNRISGVDCTTSLLQLVKYNIHWWKNTYLSHGHLSSRKKTVELCGQCLINCGWTLWKFYLLYQSAKIIESTSFYKCTHHLIGLVWFMLFNATFNIISAISWWPVLLVEETGVPLENHGPVTSCWQTLSCLYRVHLTWAGFKLTTLVVIGTDCIGSCKSNYHTIATTAALKNVGF